MNNSPGCKHSGEFQSSNSLNSNCMCAFQQDHEQWMIMCHLNSNLNLFLLLKVKCFYRLHIYRKSVGCQCCKLPPYTFWGSCTFGKREFMLKSFCEWRQLTLLIILDPLIISCKSRSFQSRYRFCLYSLLPLSIPTYSVCLLQGVVYAVSDLTKKFSIHSFSSLLNSFYFLPDLLCTVIRRLNFW